MAPSRGRGRSSDKAVAHRQQSRATRSSGRASNAPGNVYDDLLAEAAAADPGDFTSDRPLKKRKGASQQDAPHSGAERQVVQQSEAEKPPLPTGNQRQPFVDHALEANQRQIIEDSSEEEEEEDDDESDFQFEDVDLGQQGLSASMTDHDINDLSISIDPSSSSKASAKKKRKPATSAERSHRLAVHKLHMVYLLSHCMLVNSWCNDEVIHKTLRSLLSKKLESYLNPQRQYSQFQRNRSFMEGLQDAVNILKLHFSVTTSGMRRSRWLEPEQDINDLFDDDVQLTGRKELRRAARDMEGSQDTGNQLFCALLRSVGVDARLVCSLQVLSFTSSGTPKEPTPKKPIKRTVYSLPSGKNALAPELSHNDAALTSSSKLQNVPSARRRLGLSSLDINPEPINPTVRRHATARKLGYPVFWVEAFNEAHQKWITIDPIVTGTLNKPSALEPPFSCIDNQLMYAIAFESDGTAKDVTVRYSKAFNAKTRKHRVETTPNGSTWLKRALKPFQRSRQQDRDSIERVELNQKLGREGLPSNVQDFKGHPIYALERHLKRHEVIHPKRECGKVNAGTAAKPKMEVVFRREDVVTCRSADKWYRVGREIKEGEQPLKYVTSRRPIPQSKDYDNEGDGDLRATASPQTGLYAVSQTDVYKPPPVERGRVPRNAFGNLDVYVPSMVPAGGTHIRHPLAKQAAQFLHVDAADAVTGFKFKGRQGTAVIEGVIVPSAFSVAVAAVIEGMEYDKELEESRSRSLTAMKVWKRLLTGLRIAERVAAYGKVDEGDTAERPENLQNNEKVVLPLSTDVDDRPLITAGKLSLLDAEIDTATAGRKKRKARRKQDEYESETQFTDDDEHNLLPPRPTRQTRSKKIYGFEGDNSEDAYEAKESGDFLAVDEHSAQKPSDTYHPEIEGGFLSDDGGGFLPDDEVEEGGFLVDDTTTHHQGAVGEGSENADAVLDSGGGFLVPDDDEDEDRTRQQDIAMRESSTGNSSVEPSHDVTHAGHEFESSNDATERSGDNVHVSLYPAIAEEEQDAGVTNPALASSEVYTGPETEKTSIQDQMVAPGTPGHTDEAVSEASDDNSLLSHDPEDEDAEPDWLESD